MAAETAISWTDATFNIAIGCEKKLELNPCTGDMELSPACLNCYAERDMENPKYGNRFKGAWGHDAQRYTLSDSYWKQPMTWQRKAAAEGVRRRVFVESLGDWAEDHPIVRRELARLWPIVAATPNLYWLFLTKRIELVPAIWPWSTAADAPENVWLGVTAENQAMLDLRAPMLLDIPAALHFLSVEPMLGGLDARAYLGCRTCSIDAGRHQGRCPGCYTGATGVRWVICGGESGPKARPTDPNHVRSLRTQCIAAGVPFHFKQWGEFGADGVRVGRKAAGRLLDGRVWDDVPQVAA